MKNENKCPRCGAELVPDEIGDAFCRCGNRVTFGPGGVVIGVKPLDEGWQDSYADLLQVEDCLTR